MDENEARAALAGANDAQSKLADRMAKCPPWRHAAFGLVMALFVGGATLPMPYQSAGTVLGAAFTVLLVLDDRKRYGVFVNGYRKGPTLPLTLALVGVLLVLLISAFYARDADLSAWTKGGLAAIAFGFATATSIIWQRVYVRELRQGAQ